MQRTRRIGASVLVVLTVVLLLLSGYGWWAKRYFLDSERFSDKAGQILEQPKVQDALAVAITDKISDASGRDLRIAQPFITNIVEGVLSSSQFETIFDAAVLRLHEAVVGGGAREAVLNLGTTVDEVRNAIEPIAPSLAEEIPSGNKLQITILDKTQLQTVYDITNAVETAVVGLTIATIVFFAAALWLSPRRWRTLALTGWVMLGFFVFSLIVVRTGRWLTGSFADRKEYSDAAQAAYKVITRGLVLQGVFFAVLGLLVGLGAGWTDRHGGWAGVKDAFGRGVGWAKAQIPEKVPAPALATAGVAVGAGTASAGTATEAAATGPEAGGPEGTRAVVEGILAPRLPEPPRKPRVAHWWRAAALLVLGLFAIWSPGSLTSVIVVLLGIVAVYLAVTEAVAAWGSPREPKEPAESDTSDTPSEAAVAPDSGGDRDSPDA
ncbi:MAG: hypothetical protein WDA60_02065 [Acidimicrobiia bacterium]|jgi:hypothetical protein